MKRLARHKNRRGIVSGNGARGLTTDLQKAARYLAVRAIRFALQSN